MLVLMRILDVPIRIEYMDRTQGEWHHDFFPFTVEGDVNPELSFLYRPGHYDILYRA